MILNMRERGGIERTTYELSCFSVTFDDDVRADAVFNEGSGFSHELSGEQDD